MGTAQEPAKAIPTVVMLNGDSITGATDIKLITVETEWGTASVNGPSIASIMFIPGLKWNSGTGLNGKRWSLSDEKTDAGLPSPQRPSTTRNPSTGNLGFSTPSNNFPSFPGSGASNSNGQFVPNR